MVVSNNSTLGDPIPIQMKYDHGKDHWTKSVYIFVLPRRHNSVGLWQSWGYSGQVCASNFNIDVTEE